MDKFIALLVVLVIALCPILSVSAEGGKVTYSGNSGNFIFEPGSEHSPTDLFTEFKGVMPGDSLSQQITVKNDADNKVKVKIYMRSLGAHEDSVDFLSQLGLKVIKSANNDMAYMFDAAANETAGLSDWVCLGTLYSGGEVNLDVILNVPVELDNQYQNQIGKLDWEFRIDELPIEPGDPQAQSTDDDFGTILWITISACFCAILIVVFVLVKKNKKENQNA